MPGRRAGIGRKRPNVACRVIDKGERRHYGRDLKIDMTMAMVPATAGQAAGQKQPRARVRRGCCQFSSSACPFPKWFFRENRDHKDSDALTPSWRGRK